VAKEVDSMKRFTSCGMGAMAALAWVVVLLTVQPGRAEDQYQLRTLVDSYFDEGKGQDIARLLGHNGPAGIIALKYKVYLYEKGEEKAVEKLVDPKTYSFKIGDRIRLNVEPYTTSYIYIFHVGPNNEHKFLVPRKKKEPPHLKSKMPVTLPPDGFFEFVAPPGAERVMVVAAEKKIDDLKLLASVLLKYNDPKATFTPQEQELKNTLYAAVEANLKSVAEQRNEEKDKVVRFRGFGDETEQKALAQQIRAKNLKGVTLELPQPGAGTMAVCVIMDKQQQSKPSGFFVTIPLSWGSSGAPADAAK
jgi:hypothetical protein